MHKQGRSHRNVSNRANSSTGVLRSPTINNAAVASPLQAGDVCHAPRRGPRLSIKQRATLIKIVVLHEDTAKIRAVLYDQYPDFPAIGDQTIRYYRRKLEGDSYREATAVYAEALQIGVARKAVRVAHLRRMFGRAIRVDALQVETIVDAEGRPEQVVVFNRDLAAYQRALLKQVQEELEGPNYRTTLPRARIQGAETPEDAEYSAEQARAELLALLSAVRERRAALAQSPADLDEEKR